MNTLRTKTLYAAVAVFAAASSHAATVTVLGSAPTVDGADIANLNAAGLVSSDLLNGDRGYAGQTFTTGSNPAGYTLNSVSFYQTRSVGTTGGRFRARLGTLSGSDITTFYTDETADEANSAYTLSGNGDDWIQYTFTTPQTLAANTTYTLDLGRGDGGNYIGWGESTGTDYSGGISYRTGGTYNSGPTNPIITDSGVDRIFHLDIAAVPEPGSLALLGLGALLIGARRRRG